MTSQRKRHAIWLAAMLSIAAVGALGTWYRARHAAGPAPPVIEPEGAAPQMIDSLRQARQLVLKRPQSGAAWGSLGMLALAASAAEPADQCFAQAAGLDPKNANWRYYRGILLTERDLTSAERELAAAVELNPEYPPARLRHGAVLVRLDRPDAAMDEFREAARLDPKSPYPLLAVARAEGARGAWDKAAEAVREAVRLAPRSREAFEELARCEERLGNATAAFEGKLKSLELPDASRVIPDPLYEQVLALEVSSRPMAQQADLAMAKGDLNEARRLLESLVRDRPELSRPRINLAHVLRSLGNGAGARRLLNETVARFPKDAFAVYSLGISCEADGDWTEGRAAYTKATELKPDYVEAWYRLGLVLERQGDRSGASAAWAQAIAADPALVPARLALGRLELEAGRLDSAERHITAAAQGAPADPDVRAAQAALSAARNQAQ